MVMAMRQRAMGMPMRVRNAGAMGRVMQVGMMLVVRVFMFMREFIVGVQMVVDFAQVKPQPDRHKGTGKQKRYGDGFAQDHHSKRRPEHWCDRKVRPSARGA